MVFTCVTVRAGVMVLAVSQCYGVSLCYGLCCVIVLAHVIVLACKRALAVDWIVDLSICFYLTFATSL